MKYSWTLNRPEPINLDTREKAQKLAEFIKNKDLIAIDTETTGLNIASDVVVYFSIAYDLNNRFFLTADKLKEFEDVFNDNSKAWIGSQIKYDANIIANSGYELRGDLYCTLTMDRLVDPGKPHGLKEAYEREFDEKMATFAQTFYPRDKKGRPYKPKNKEMYHILEDAFDADPDSVIDYASLDAWAVLRLFYRLREHLRETRAWHGGNLWELFLLYEVPMTRCLYQMEREGVPLDVEYLAEARPKIKEELSEIEKELYSRAGKIINPRSTMQLRQLFFHDLGLPVTKKTNKGAPCTDVHVLEALVLDGVKEAELILKHRKLQKLLGTYVEGLLDRLDKNGRIHTTLNQHVADTGRLSSTDPNLQNQMRSGSTTFDIRRSFVAPPGCVLLVADYDQLEMYLTGHWSGENALISAAISGKDIHSSNAQAVYGEPYEAIDEAKKKKEDLTERDRYLLELRHRVKTVCFGLIYGKASRSLGIDLGYPEKLRTEHPDWSDKDINYASTEMAQKIIDSFFAGLPDVQSFIEGTHKRMAEYKYTESILGRRRWFNCMNWQDQIEHQKRAAAKRIQRWSSMQNELTDQQKQELSARVLCWCQNCKDTRDDQRAGVNHIIQGSAADILMVVMGTISRNQHLRELGVKLVLQIHDELVFIVPDNPEIITEAGGIIQNIMENTILNLRVPLRAEPGIGRNWSEAK